MFVEQGVSPKNNFWKYLTGSLIVIAASFVGQIPLTLAVIYKIFMDGGGFPSSEQQIMNYYSPNITLALLMFSFVVALFSLYLVVKHLHKQKFISITTARPKVDWSRIFFSFILWAVISAASVAIAYYFSPEDYIINFKPIPFLILVLIGTIFIPIQTSTEELVFRGYLMQGFANLSLNKWFPLIMTSVIFGTLHIFNPEVEKMGYIILVYYIGTGLFLGIVALMDDGLELSLGFHGANNLTGALLITADWSVFQTDSILRDLSQPSAGFDVILPVVVIYPILLFIFSKKYSWNNWKERLTGNIAIVEPFELINPQDEFPNL